MAGQIKDGGKRAREGGGGGEPGRVGEGEVRDEKVEWAAAARRTDAGTQAHPLVLPVVAIAHVS